MVLLEERLRRGAHLPCAVQALQVGPLGPAANHAELFCALGPKIKAGSSAPFTFVMTRANGAVGYVPTTHAFRPQGGGYAQRLRRQSRAAVDRCARIREASLALLSRLWRGRPVAAPAWEPVQPGQPWSAPAARHPAKRDPPSPRAVRSGGCRKPAPVDPAEQGPAGPSPRPPALGRGPA